MKIWHSKPDGLKSWSVSKISAVSIGHKLQRDQLQMSGSEFHQMEQLPNTTEIPSSKTPLDHTREVHLWRDWRSTSVLMIRIVVPYAFAVTVPLTLVIIFYHTPMENSSGVKMQLVGQCQVHGGVSSKTMTNRHVYLANISQQGEKTCIFLSPLY